MRGFSLLMVAALGAACTGGDSRRKPSADDAGQASSSKDAFVPENLVVELRWVQIVDRRPKAGDEPSRKTVESAVGMDETFALPDYAARDVAERPEVHQGEWTMAIPAQTPATFELTVDPDGDHRLIVFTRGWKRGADGKLAPAVVLKSNWQMQSSSGWGEGPNQVGFGAAVLGVWQAAKALGHHDASFAYYELMEARFVAVSAEPPVVAIRGEVDTVGGQQERERAWPIKVVTLP